MAYLAGALGLLSARGEQRSRERAPENGLVRGCRLGVSLAAGRSELDKDATAVELADTAVYQAMSGQPVHQTGQCALAQVHRVGKVLRTEHVLGLGEPGEHLEVTHT